MTSRAHAALGESSFTPTSLKVPLHGVRLGGPNASIPDVSIYTCNAGDCMVDMADDAAVGGLFAGGADIPPGTYDHVSFDTCDAGASSYTVLVSGAVSLGGLQFHTSANLLGLLTLDLSAGAPTPVVFAGCSTTMPLPSAVTIAGGDEVVISSFFSLANIAWATLSENDIGGCATNGSQSVCSAMPVPVAYMGKVAPTVQTYFITEDQLDLLAARAGGQMLLLLDPNGTPFGGFARRYYSALSIPPRVNYDTPVKQIMANGPDGEDFTITTWGGGSSDGTPSPYYIKFDAFELATHTGNLFGPSSPTPIPYLAVQQLL